MRVRPTTFLRRLGRSVVRVALALAAPAVAFAELSIAASNSYLQPGQPGLVAEFSAPVMLADGAVAYWGSLTSEANARALFVKRGDSLTLVLRASTHGLDGQSLSRDGTSPVVTARPTEGTDEPNRVYRVDGQDLVLLLSEPPTPAPSAGLLVQDTYSVRAGSILRHTTFRFRQFRPGLLPSPGSVPPRDLLTIIRDGRATPVVAAQTPLPGPGFPNLADATLDPSGTRLVFTAAAAQTTVTPPNGTVEYRRGVYAWEAGTVTELIGPEASFAGTSLSIRGIAVADDGAIAVFVDSTRKLLLWHAGVLTALLPPVPWAIGGVPVTLTPAPNPTVPRAVWIDAQYVYACGQRTGRYPLTGGERQTSDFVYRVPRAGGVPELFFDPRTVFAEPDHLELRDFTLGDSPARLAFAVRETFGSPQAIYEGAPPFARTPFPAVPSGFPLIRLFDRGAGWDYPYGVASVLAAEISGPGPFTYEWAVDGRPIAPDDLRYRGADGPALTLYPYGQDYHRGRYTLRVANATGTTLATSLVSIGTTGTVNLDGRGTPPPLVNCSVRGYTTAAEGTFTGGVALLPPLGGISWTPDRGETYHWLAGTAQRLLIRAVGPGLAPFAGPSVQPALATRLTLYQGATALAANDGAWSSDPQVGSAAAAAGAFPLSPGSRDSAVVATLPPLAAYTAQVEAPGGEGTVLLEFYVVGGSGNLRNLSARGTVADREPYTLYLGFVIAADPNQLGTPTRLILLRAIGPGLRAFGVSGAVAAPLLELYSGNTLLARNAAHGDAPNPAAIARAATVFGAFPLASGSADAALLLELPPGAYIMRLSGQPGSSGIALAELYSNL